MAATTPEQAIAIDLAEQHGLCDDEALHLAAALALAARRRWAV